MSGGEIAGLITATAFAIPVVSIIRVLSQISRTLEKVGQTITKANTTIETVAKSVDLLSRQIEGLSVKSNKLLPDINGKVVTIDPLFTAAADLDEDTSEPSHSSKDAATKVGGIGKATAEATATGKIGGIMMKSFKNKKHTETTGGE